MTVYRYDLSKQPASFDFVVWLATVRSLGATEIVLDDAHGFKHKFSKSRSVERLDSIVIGALKYFYIPWSFGSEGEEIPHRLDTALKVHRDIGMKKLPVKLEAGDYCTFTIRNMMKTPERNTSEAFRRFGEKHGVVIEDWSNKPISLGARMDLYRKAKMNYFGNNGPATLAYLSDIPYRIVKFASEGGASLAFLAKIGIKPGFQFPWKNDNQLILWKDDTWEVLENDYRSN